MRCVWLTFLLIANAPNLVGSQKVDSVATSATPIVVEVKNQPKTDSDRAEDYRREQIQASINRWTVGLTAVIAVAAILQFGGIVGQIVIYKRQAVLMEGALKASEKSTDALMNGDRAWISVWPGNWEPELHPLWEPGDPPPSDSSFMNPFAHAFPAHIKNVGKTPARIHQVRIKYVILEKHPAALQGEPNFADVLAEPAFMLVPGDDTTILALLSPSPILSKQQVAAIRSQQAYLFGYGLVRYSDVYDRAHETRFGYIYHFPQGGMINFERNRFKRGGPESYNMET
jgi:hypothetical protein